MSEKSMESIKNEEDTTEVSKTADKGKLKVKQQDTPVEYMEKYVIPTALMKKKAFNDRGFKVTCSSFMNNKLYVEITAPNGERYGYNEKNDKLVKLEVK
jgi:hypothetical protein